jgi:hypothetical protein
MPQLMQTSPSTVTLGLFASVFWNDKVTICNRSGFVEQLDNKLGCNLTHLLIPLNVFGGHMLQATENLNHLGAEGVSLKLPARL